MLVSLNKKVGFLVLGSTGCSCCRNENFAEGFVDTIEAAREVVAKHTTARTVASQYSANGQYEIRKVDYEVLEDGESTRILVGSRIIESETFFEKGEDEYYAFCLGERVK